MGYPRYQIFNRDYRVMEWESFAFGLTGHGHLSKIRSMHSTCARAERSMARLRKQPGGPMWIEHYSPHSGQSCTDWAAELDVDIAIQWEGK